MPYIAIDLNVTPHAVSGWGTSVPALRELYPNTQVLTVNNRVIQMIVLGIGPEGLGLLWTGQWYKTVLGHSAPGAVNIHGNVLLSRALPSILAGLQVSTADVAHDIISNLILVWTGNVEDAEDSTTFYNTANDPDMDAVAQAVLAHSYMVERYYVDDGIPDQYTFLRDPRE